MPSRDHTDASLASQVLGQTVAALERQPAFDDKLIAALRELVASGGIKDPDAVARLLRGESR